ncbi:acetyltransferase [Flagellimonas marinaquae]
MKAIIYGIGRFAEYVSYVISNDSKYEIIGFCIDQKLMGSDIEFSGLPLVAFETVEDVFRPQNHKMFIAVGDNAIRAHKFQQAIDKGYSFLSYISSKSNVWDDLTYGQNVFVSEDSVIQPYVTIADNSLLIGARVAHHSVIGKHSLLSGCLLGGSVVIGNNCFLGLNTTVKQGVCVGDNNMIGMGCIISKNTKDYEVYRVGDHTVRSAVPRSRFHTKL